MSTINFESAPTGAFSSLTVAPGVTMSGSSYTGGNQSVNNTPDFPSAPDVDGFNTTPGGANYVEVDGGSLLFSFAKPVDAFGAFLTGVQTIFYQDTITFSDGTSYTIDVPGAGTSGSEGALDFVGFTDPGQSISSVEIYAGNGTTTGADFIGVDDVSYGTASTAVTPEPSSLVLLLTGFVGLGLGWQRMRPAASER